MRILVKSGAQGVYDYIISRVKIATTTVNINKVYAMTALEQLDWFKRNFLSNAGDVLGIRDKAGIRYVMSNK